MLRNNVPESPDVNRSSVSAWDQTFALDTIYFMEHQWMFGILGFTRESLALKKHYVQDHGDLTLKAAAAAELLRY